MMELKVFKTEKDREWAARSLDNFLAKYESERKKQFDAEISKLKTLEDVKRWQKNIRDQLADILGEFPEQTALNPRTVGKIERSDIIVEKIIFESQPKYYVTANLYIPRNYSLPAPGVLVPCGHGNLGKGYRNYRDAGIGLARKGYVALVYDPTGQGERSECFDPRTRRHIVSRGVSQHHWTGKPCYLTGMTLAGYRTWDGIRCLDYLSSREEVDPNRIGVMGNSGGGEMTLLITAVDERVKACAASHPGGSMENTQLRGRHPPDPRIYSLIPPRPCCIIVGRESGEEASHKLKIDIMKPFYEACGCSERLQMVLVEGKHDLKKPKREASYEWLNRWLGRQDETPKEPKFRTISDRALWCTKDGQVEISLKGESMFSLNRARSRKIAPKRQIPEDEASLKEQLSHLLLDVTKRIGFIRVSTPLNPKTIEVERVKEGIIELLIFESEPGIPIPSILLEPYELQPNLPVVIHVNENGKPTSLEEESIPAELFRLGYPVFSIDARDTGETSCCTITRKKEWREYDQSLWRHDMLAIRALGIGRSLSAMRVLDIIRAVDFIQERNNLKDRPIIAVGEGKGGIWAMKAASFDARIKGVIALRMLASYRLLTENRYYNQFGHFWLPGALIDYDIVDLPALVAPRPVWILDPIDHMSRRLSEKQAEDLFTYARGVYGALRKTDALIIKRTAGSFTPMTRWVTKLLHTIR